MMVEDVQEQANCEYQHNQKVRLLHGFYKGKVGTIKSVFTITPMIKGGQNIPQIWYHVEIEVNEKKLIVKMMEEQLHLYELKFRMPFSKG